MFVLIREILDNLIPDIANIIYELYCYTMYHSIRLHGGFRRRLSNICISDTMHTEFLNTSMFNKITSSYVKLFIYRDDRYSSSIDSSSVDLIDYDLDTMTDMKDSCYHCRLSIIEYPKRYLYYGYNSICSEHDEKGCDYDRSCSKCRVLCVMIGYRIYHERCFMERYDIACNFWINIKPQA
jgi:hypothetical protein